jgi:hypothetical protein
MRIRPFCELNPGGDLRSRAVTSAVSSAQQGLTSVFGMGTGVTPAVWLPGKSGSSGREREETSSGCGLRLHEIWRPELKNERRPRGTTEWKLVAKISLSNMLGKFYGQAERPISTGKLHALLRFHLPPIKVVVFDWPSYPPESGLGDLISRRASRLDAFSDYLFRTSLPSYATGVTARSQEVRPSRSSRTRDSSSQVSCAHTR